MKNELNNLQKAVILAPYSTFQIGGPADYFFRATNKDELKNAYIWGKNQKLPIFIVGGGSNVIFSDKGFRGLVIRNEANHIHLQNTVIEAESGALWSQLIQLAIQNNLSGIERLIGLPGTIGAAVRGNAGCNGVETKDLLISATLLDEVTFNEKEVESEYFNFSYRESKIKRDPELVLSVKLGLKPHKGTPDDLRATMKEVLLDRNGKQPTGKNAGSFFKNPSLTFSAGRAIDEAGLKGFTVGDAQISEKHANFFMNLGKATQQDLIQLARHAAKKVQEKTGIQLEQEVNILDEFGHVMKI